MRKKLSPTLLALTASIYISQYLGVAFVMAAASAILRQDGVSLDKLALLNLVALPLFGKIFYAPLIDRYRLVFQGQYRSWLLCAQLLMTLTLVLVGLLDFKQQLPLIVALFVVYAFATAMQDVAIDGLACKIFSAEQRRYANSIQFAGNSLGMIIGGGVLLMTYPWLGWRASLWVLAGLTALSWGQLLFFRESEQSATTVTQGVRALLSDCKAFIGANRRWFGLLLCYPLAMSGAFALLNPMLVDAKWALQDIGFAVRIYGSVIGLLSALSASYFIGKWGRVRTLSALTLALALALGLMLPIAWGYTSAVWVYAAITAYFSVFTALLATFGTLIMDRAADTGRYATFFTLQFSMISGLGFVYAGLSMAAAKFLGYGCVIIVGMVCAVLCAVMSVSYFKEKP
ncbi:MAG: MFS transporter [Gammaproteobacteria bacterium]|nr:MAG: MFS transporter [Gammaproteobacteria bacterium]